MIGAVIDGIILWIIIRIFSKHEGDDELTKLILICIFTSCMSLAAWYFIDDWAVYIGIPLLIWLLVKHCHFSMGTAVKVVAIQTVIGLIL